MEKKKLALSETNESESIIYKEGPGKANEWLKKQPKEAKDSSLEIKKVEEASEAVKGAYPPEEEKPKNYLKNPDLGNTFKMPEKRKRDSLLRFIQKSFIKNWKKLAFTTLLTGMSMSAAGADTKNSDRELNDSIIKTEDAKKFEAKINKTSERIEINMANYFSTDKAEISKENVSEISKLVSDYISSLNSGNINQFLSSTPELDVSCDPRNTNSYENGNRGLGQARADTTQDKIRGLISKYDFSKSGLTKDQIEGVIKKFSSLKLNIPENGVIDFHKVINPKTGQLFNDAEWADLQKDKDALLKVYETMRFVNLNLAVLNNKVPENVLETKKGIFDVAQFEKVILLVDKSPSMEAHVKALMDSLNSGTNIDIPTSVMGYTNKIDAAFDAKNLKDAAKIIKEMHFVNEDEELTIDATIQALRKTEKDGQNAVMFIVTDEELQHVSREKLDTLTKLSEDKKVTLMFTIMVGGVTHQLNLEEVRGAFEEKYKQGESDRIRDSINTSNQITIFKKVLANQERELVAGNNNKDYLRKLNKEITETKSGITQFENTLKRLQEVNISNFKDIASKKKIPLKSPDFTGRSDTVSL